MTTQEVSSLFLHRLWEMKGKGTWKRVADQLGVRPSYLSDLVKGRRDPGPKILGQMGLTKVVEVKEGE